MNPYLEPHGFLGTGASLLADVTVLAYLLLIIPAMLVGFVFARRKMFRPYHKWTMTTILIVNWILIIFLMIVAYRYDVAGNIANQPDNTRYLLPTIHGVIGLVAQLLATFVIYRMFHEDIQVRRAKARGEKDTSRYWFRRAKPIMRLTLTLWLITAALGIFNYLTRYDIIPTYHLSGQVAAPVVTPEVLAPVVTLEIVPPAATGEMTIEAPVVTVEVTVDAPVATEEIAVEVLIATEDVTVAAPVATEEVELVQTPTPLIRRTPRAPVATVEVFAPAETEELGTATPTATATRTWTARAPAATPDVK